jgi:hypothetical protein
MKKKMTALIAGASLMALAGSASAIDINIYGASAQWTFWNSLANDYLASQGCTTITGPVVDSTGKHGITSGTGAGACAAGINIRYSSKASYDGVFAAMGSCNGQTGCNPNPDSCGNPSRLMITSTSNTALSCQPITIGASDVAAASFTQASHGLLKGPLGGAQTDRVFTGITLPSNVTAAHGGIVVPFGFFLNNSVQLSKCVSGPNAGLQCNDTTAPGFCGAGTCTTGNVDNVSREMVANIFNGQSSYFWSDFGDGYSVTGKTAQTNDFIVACIRHAGSGTVSTLDWSVMNSKWGAALAVNAQPVLGGASETVYFNDGTPDEMNCVNGSGAWTGAGAIGFADGDILIPASGLTNPYTSTYAVNYNGFAPQRVNVRNGLYDFFTNEWLFINTSTYPAGSAENTQFNNLIAYASNPTHITATTLQGKANYWTAVTEMKFNKSTDQKYPAYVGATASPAMHP